MTAEDAETEGNSPKGIKCLGYSGRKYYLMGELDDDVHSYSASELLNRSTLCELRAAADWKAGANEGKVDWPTEGSHLLAACKKAGKFQLAEESPAKPIAHPKPNGALLEANATPIDGWLEMLQRTDRGIKGNDYNVTVALRYAPKIGGKIGWDVRQLRYVSTTDTPAGPAGLWTDSHTARLTVWLQGYDVPVTTRHVDTALSATRTTSTFDPLGDYLNGIVWDGQERIGTWLHDYCRADRSAANSIMGSKFLIQAVARALRPGCQADAMLVLEGHQGKRKSSAIRVLGGEWTSENLPDFHSKDAMQIIGTKWIVEVSEMAASRRSDIPQLNSFVTRREDTFRPPYGQHPITAKRWSVMIGNYNPDGTGILQDPTGARRFWIAAVGAIDIDALQNDRDQLWAEAVHCFNRNDPWWLSDDEQAPVVSEQEDRQDDDEWLPAIEKWLSNDPMTNLPVGQTTSAEVAIGALQIPLERLSRASQMRIARCLIKLGFKRVKIGPVTARRNAFVRE